MLDELVAPHLELSDRAAEGLALAARSAMRRRRAIVCAPATAAIAADQPLALEVLMM